MQKLLPVTFPEGYPELLEQVGQVVVRKLIEGGVDVGRAPALGFEITEGIRTEIGGGQHYLPRGITYQLSQRDKEIFAAFNGTNYNALSQQYGLSSVRVRDIIKRGQQAARQASKSTSKTV